MNNYIRNKEQNHCEKIHLLKKVLILSADFTNNINDVTCQLQREFSARNLEVRMMILKSETPSQIEVIHRSDKSESKGQDIMIIENHWLSSGKASQEMFSNMLKAISPDAIIFMYEPGRGSGDIDNLLRLHEQVLATNYSSSRSTICLISFGLTGQQSISEEKRLEIATGLPIVDLPRSGVNQIADDLLELFYEPDSTNPVSTISGQY